MQVRTVVRIYSAGDPAPAPAARPRGGRSTAVRGALLAVVALAALLGLGAMHALPMPMPMSSPGSAVGSMAGQGTAVPAVPAPVHAMRPAAAEPAMAGRDARAAAALRQVTLHPAVRSATVDAVPGCGMDHAGCLVTLTASVRAHVPAEAAVALVGPAPRAGPSGRAAAAQAACLPTPSGRPRTRRSTR